MDGSAAGVQLAVSGRTDPGLVRAENQDNMLIADLAQVADSGAGEVVMVAPLVTSGRFSLGPAGALLLVADGMGGVEGGAVASRLAVTTIYQELTGRWSGSADHGPEAFALRLKEAVEAANARIFQESSREGRYRGMGTTATLAGILDGFVYLAQVGDSRGYLIRRGRAVQLTRDQSVVQEFIDAGVLTEEEAEHSPHRNTILQALGVTPTVRVEVTYQALRRGDVVLLCSDGLTRVVRDTEICAAADEAYEPSALCDHLVELANARGGPDNITVVAARLGGHGIAEPGIDDTVVRRSYRLPDAS